MASAVANRYARALADLVLAPGSPLKAEDAVAQLKSVEQMIAGSWELKNALLTPAIQASRKRAVMAKLGAELQVSQLVRNFIFVVIDHRRIAIISEIREAFELIVDERLGFVRAEVTSASALGAERPLGLVHIDAHCDTMGAIDGTKFHHGGPFRQAVLAGALDPERTIQIGIRGAAEIFWGFSYDSGMTVLHIEDVDRLGIAAVIERARAVVGDGPTYISFDVDGLDPAYAPGTGTPEAGGLTPREAQAILHGLKGLDIVGGDVVEVAPQYDPGTLTAMVGAQMLFEIFTLVTLGPHFPRRAA